MSTPMEDRNAAICARYLDEETAESIALDYGLSVGAIRVIVREGGALQGKRTRTFKSDEEKVITPTHARIGVMLSHNRAFVRGIDRKMAADELGWSMQRVASVEKGAYNLTLLDLQDLARFLKITIEEIVHDKRTEGTIKVEYAAGAGTHLSLVLPTTPTAPTAPAPEDLQDPKRQSNYHRQEAL